MKKALWLALAAIFILSSCKEDEKTNTPPTHKDPLEGYVMLGEEEATTLGYSIKLYSKEDPFTGYNYLVARLLETGTSNQITDANVVFKPMMDMGTMKHSCPTEQPIYNIGLEGYAGTATFVMPSMGGSWSVIIDVTPEGGTANEEVEIPITVEDKDEARIYNFMKEGTGYFIAMVEPWKPAVGMNDYEIVIYKRESMMSWPAVTDLKVEIEPQMPSMGHGSPNNVHPVHTENGHYVGQVNFTMDGHWIVINTIKADNDSVMHDSGFFDITF